ncbi:MAG: hypothetical protein JSS89_00970 [Bacteroidetes bacterium]|nr:hypothetical protein [Bacteroidota bacterium]
MNNPKIIQLLQGFSEVQIKRFVDAVRSPYFTTNRTLEPLAVAIAAAYPFTDPDLINDEQLHARAHPDEEFKYFTFRNRISDLYAIATQVLQFERLDKNPSMGMLLKAQGLRMVKAHGLFERYIEQTSKELSAIPVRDEEYWLTRARLLEEETLYLTLVRPRTDRQILQDELDTFLRYAVMRLLRQYTTMAHEKPMNDVGFVLHGEQEIRALIEEHAFLRAEPTIMMYTAVLDMMRTQTEGSYQALKRIYDESVHELSYIDGYMANLFLSSYCTDMANVHGRVEYWNDIYDLMQRKIDIGHLGAHNLLYPDLIFTVRAAGYTGHETWVRGFMTEMSPALPADVREDVLRFCDAFLDLQAGRHASALRTFAQVGLNDDIWKAQVRTYTVMCHVALGQYEQARFACDAFRHFLAKASTLSSYYVPTLKQFVRIVPKLVAIMESDGSSSTTKREKLMAEIDAMSSNVFMIKHWTRSAASSIAID